jgi:hypothetical protein
MGKYGIEDEHEQNQALESYIDVAIVKKSMYQP